MEMVYAQHEKSLETVSLDENHPHAHEDVHTGTTKSTPLNNFVTVFTTRHSNPLTIAFEAYCSALQAVEITVDFGASTNFLSHPSPSAESLSTETRLSLVVRPFQRTYLGYLSVQDEYKRAALKVQFDWKYLPATDDEKESYFSASTARLAKEIAEAQAADFPALHFDPENAQTIEICEKKKIHFLDLDFPPNTLSLTLSPSLADGEGEKKEELDMIEWKRPRDFMKGEISVFLDEISASDINQGALGDCWFLSALAALTEFPELVRDIFIDASEKYNEYGVYNLMFYKHGLEQVVRVDDFFPCNAGIYAGPKYSRCAGNELWVLLAEKAFAKLHGAYSNITAGFTAEALMDLTGAPCKTYRLDDALVRSRIESGELWQDLVSFDEAKYLLTASTPSQSAETENTTGLVPGHAYTLVTSVEVQGVRLCQLRNPWGSLEWSGDWSDSSSLWTEEMKDALTATLNARNAATSSSESSSAVEKKDDGLFWISFDDLCKHFNSVSVCFVKHRAYTDKPWKVQRRKFFFDFDLVDNRHAKATFNVKNAASKDYLFKVRNPLYALRVEDEGEFCFTVHQQDTRCQDSPSPIDIGVAVVQKDHNRPGKYHLIAGTGISADRQNQLEPFRLTPGDYIVVPITSGSKLRQDFSERASSESSESVAQSRVQLVEKDANGVTHFSPEVRSALKELFAHLDVDGDSMLSKQEFDALMLRTEGCAVSKKAFAHLVTKFEDDKECQAKHALSFKAFLHAQLHAFNSKGCDEEKLFNTFKALGFDDSLKFCNGRPAALSVHGTAQFSLEGLPHEENCLTEAQEMVIAAQGKASLFDDARIAVFVHRTGYYGASFMVENRHTQPLVFSLDMSASVNVVSHQGTLVHTDLVPPGESVVFHHLAPRDTTQSWTWSYSASYLWDPKHKAPAPAEAVEPTEDEVAEEPVEESEEQEQGEGEAVPAEEGEAEEEIQPTEDEENAEEEQ